MANVGCERRQILPRARVKQYIDKVRACLVDHRLQKYLIHAMPRAEDDPLRLPSASASGTDDAIPSYVRAIASQVAVE